MTRLILTYALQMFSKEFDIHGDEKALSSAKVYIKMATLIKVRKRFNVLEVPEEILPTQTILAHIPPPADIFLQLTTVSSGNVCCSKRKEAENGGSV